MPQPSFEQYQIVALKLQRFEVFSRRIPTLDEDNESNGARLIEAANGRKASRGWCQVVLGGTTGTAAIKRASTQDIMRLRGSKKAAAPPAEAVEAKTSTAC